MNRTIRSGSRWICAIRAARAKWGAGGCPARARAIGACPACLPKRHTPFDDGYRPHQIEIWPDHPDRAYVAYIDGGAMIFDISSLAQVRAAARRATRRG